MGNEEMPEVISKSTMHAVQDQFEIKEKPNKSKVLMRQLNHEWYWQQKLRILNWLRQEWDFTILPGSEIGYYIACEQALLGVLGE